jgi:hypothetical protein
MRNAFADALASMIAKNCRLRDISQHILADQHFRRVIPADSAYTVSWQA